MSEGIVGAGLIPQLSREDLAAIGVPEHPRIVGMFEGYGGLTAGVQHVTGGDLVAYAEIEATSIRLLEAHHPGVPNLGDVSAVDWSPWVGKVDIVLAGFPCQDVSAAGLGKGLRVGTRSGLWFEVARMIAVTRPSLVVIENVRGLRSAPAGVKDWNEDDDEGTGDVESDAWGLGVGGRGDRPVLRALGAVVGDLAELGYMGTWDSVRASDVGAPHRRERVFIHAIPE